MTYRGTMKRGVVVFAKSPPLEDGTAVRVEPIARRRNATSSPKKRSFQPVGRWQGEPGELGRLLSLVQQMRDSDYA